MKAWATSETVESRRDGVQKRATHGPKKAWATSEAAVEVVKKPEGPHEADQTWSNLLSGTRKKLKRVVLSTNKNRWAK